MIRYVPTSELAVARALSDALWGLTRPPHVRAEHDTQHMFACVTMTDGSVWLAVDTEFTIPVHAEAELDGIASILQPWIDTGALGADTNANLQALIESLRGKRMIPWEVFPQIFKDQSKTQQELIDLKLWPSVPSI